jgi:serine acetyltransferase
MSIGSPAVVDQDVNAQVFVTGTNGAVYTQTITPDSGSAWTVIPAKTQFGPAASQAPMPF